MTLSKLELTLKALSSGYTSVNTIGYTLGSDGEIILEDEVNWALLLITFDVLINTWENAVCLYDRFIDLVECFDEDDVELLFTKAKCTSD